ncbi:DUF2280 domain-containing protein [Psychrobacter cryohalolentis]|uniref:DUF2280 domain-containing protein n=1 Tax=Psychrobacter sp. D2 TaxID=2759702 RepID=UPI0015E5CFAA|nr:DUF2280 domain-containing protein [Psychrobacter sp. D2]MBA2057339.1 DUF2280 domain-containing protein [Psychrobacter sp. D2]
MATLNNGVKTFIVQGLATYMTPSEVAEAVNQEFGITITRQQVAKYDPHKAAGVNLAQKWQDLFKQFRDDFNNDIQAIPIANKAYRLNMLDRMARDAEKSKNRPLAAALAEQAAKEMGEVFTNKQKLDHQSSDKSMTPTVNNFNGDAQAASQAYQDIMGGK